MASLHNVLFMLVMSLLVLEIAGKRHKPTAGSSVVRRIPDFKTYNTPGMTHITIAGAVRDGIKEVETFIETTAPGKGTPIHRHDCVEVVINVKGCGTAYIAPMLANNKPGKPIVHPFGPNTTFTVPVNSRHQIINTGHEDLFYYAMISRPPLKAVIYSSWNAAYDSGKLEETASWDVNP